jgi:hypothetical protein
MPQQDSAAHKDEKPPLRPAAGMPDRNRGKADEEPISLVEEVGTAGGTAVRALGAAAAAGKKAEFKRPLNVTGQGATRCRIFHSKIAIASLENMEHTINEWLDSGKIEVKQVGHIIGTMEGKRPEPNLVVLVWY